MRICFFGRLGDRIGRTLDFSVTQPCTVEELRAVISSRFPESRDDLASGSTRVCIADQVVPEDHMVEPDDEVDILPPVSGG